MMRKRWVWKGRWMVGWIENQVDEWVNGERMKKYL